MSLADRIAVMDRGVLQQYGTPAEVYNRPANTFVAHFMGSPRDEPPALPPGRRRGAPAARFGAAGRLPHHRCRPAASRRAARARGRSSASARSRSTSRRRRQRHSGLLFEVDLVEPIGARTIVHLRAGDARGAGGQGQALRARPARRGSRACCRSSTVICSMRAAASRWDGRRADGDARARAASPSASARPSPARGVDLRDRGQRVLLHLRAAQLRQDHAAAAVAGPGRAQTKARC